MQRPAFKDTQYANDHGGSYGKRYDHAERERKGRLGETAILDQTAFGDDNRCTSRHGNQCWLCDGGSKPQCKSK